MKFTWGSSTCTTSTGLVLLSTGGCWVLVVGGCAAGAAAGAAGGGTWTVCRSWGRTSCTLVPPAGASSLLSDTARAGAGAGACCCCCCQTTGAELPLESPEALLEDEVSVAFIGRRRAIGVPSRETGVTDAAWKSILLVCCSVD
jgi:hypothetical protein